METLMLTLDFHPAGRHFLQIPGPSPVPDRILRAMSYRSSKLTQT
jgi:alanine-glyoxylate transaminase/serine-glyoxylate transaminase/serine-pyruvate transaminase